VSHRRLRFRPAAVRCRHQRELEIDNVSARPLAARCMRPSVDLRRRSSKFGLRLRGDAADKAVTEFAVAEEFGYAPQIQTTVVWM
jgi:hypothetical protein